jgi:hypothetical protein
MFCMMAFVGAPSMWQGLRAMPANRRSLTIAAGVLAFVAVWFCVTGLAFTSTLLDWLGSEPPAQQ